MTVLSVRELLTAVRTHLDLVVIVFVDGAYAAIRDQQTARFGHGTDTEFTGLDCAALAIAVGAHHIRLCDDAEATLRAAVAASGVTLVEVAVGDSLPLHWVRLKSTARSHGARRLRAWLRSWHYRS